MDEPLDWGRVVKFVMVRTSNRSSFLNFVGEILVEQIRSESLRCAIGACPEAVAGIGGWRLSGATGAVANLYNRQLQKKKVSDDARKHQDAVAAGDQHRGRPRILTGQAQRQGGSEAAKRFASEQQRTSMLAEISGRAAGLRDFDGKADGAMTPGLVRGGAGTRDPDPPCTTRPGSGHEAGATAHDSDGFGFGPGGGFARYRQLSGNPRKSRRWRRRCASSGQGGGRPGFTRCAWSTTS